MVIIAPDGWSKKRRDDGTPGGRYTTGRCPVVVYVRRTHDGTLARGIVQATGQTRLTARRYVVRHHVFNLKVEVCPPLNIL